MINDISLSKKVISIVIILSLLSVVMGLIGVDTSQSLSFNVVRLFNDRVVPLEQLKKVSDAYAVGIVDATNKVSMGGMTTEQGYSSLLKSKEIADENWKQYLSTEMTKEEKDLIDKTEDLLLTVKPMLARLENEMKAGNKEAISRMASQELYQTIDPFTGSVDSLVKLQLSVAEEILKDSQVQAKKTIQFLYGLIVGVTVLALAMTTFTIISLGTLKKSVFKISGNVQQVATAAAQSSNAIGLVSDGSKTQTESINQAVTAVEQSVSVLTEVSKSSDKATEVAKVSAQAVAIGKAKMAVMVEVVARIQENSNKINKITGIISGIASQTNMLALNAAIEAARAGELGKGFAVVADQVKTLAESSNNSVDDIVELIDKAKIDAAEAVKVAEIVNGEMEKIEEGVRQTELMMQSISTAMEEQVSTTEELSHNMDTLRDVGASNANAAEEITETIIELSKISSETNEELKRFNI